MRQLSSISISTLDHKCKSLNLSNSDIEVAWRILHESVLELQHDLSNFEMHHVPGLTKIRLYDGKGIQIRLNIFDEPNDNSKEALESIHNHHHSFIALNIGTGTYQNNIFDIALIDEGKYKFSVWKRLPSSSTLMKTSMKSAELIIIDTFEYSPGKSYFIHSTKYHNITDATEGVMTFIIRETRSSESQYVLSAGEHRPAGFETRKIECIDKKRAIALKFLKDVNI